MISGSWYGREEAESDGSIAIMLSRTNDNPTYGLLIKPYAHEASDTTALKSGTLIAHRDSLEHKIMCTTIGQKFDVVIRVLGQRELVDRMTRRRKPRPFPGAPQRQPSPRPQVLPATTHCLGTKNTHHQALNVRPPIPTYVHPRFLAALMHKT
jgi:hypothetical protein